MPQPLLITLEYPPSSPQTIPSERSGPSRYGGVASYLAGEVASSPNPVRVVKAQDFFWDKWPAWLPLLWRVVPPPVFRREQGGGFDYLWISHILPMGYIALWWKWRFKTPYRVYVHGLDLVNARRSSWKRFWASLILKHADEIVANSKATRALLSRYGIDPSVARVSYPNVPKVDPGAYRLKAAELRQEHGINKRPVLLTISRLVRRKGIDVVIRALPEVWKHAPDVVYAVVGAGDDQERLSVIASEALAERGNLNNEPSDGQIASARSSPRNDKVIFIGSVSDEEKYAWLSACDCFILTPIDDPNDFEGYGIVYKEAQMFGKPVIGSKVGGVPEAIGDDGVLVEPGNLKQITQAILNNFPSLARRG